MDPRVFKKGMLVRVTGDLVETYGTYGRSSDGAMDRMKNNIFPIKDIVGRRIMIKNPESKKMLFTFCKSDLTIVAGDYKEPKPKIFEFDINHLDI